MTQRDGMGKEERGGFRMGNMCIPVADSCCYMANQYNIVKLKNKLKNFVYSFILGCAGSSLLHVGFL